jgi:hypothetical protein
MPKSQTNALARRADAVQRFRNGENFDQIAQGVGYANRGNAHRAVTTALRERIVEDIDTYRQIELERIDLVEAELLAIATRSKSDAAKIRALREVLTASRDRSKLLGLYDHFPQAEPEQKMLVDLDLGKLRKGNTCRISGDAECGFVPKEHSTDCVKQTLGFVPYAQGEASNEVTASPSSASLDGEDLLEEAPS